MSGDLIDHGEDELMTTERHVNESHSGIKSFRGRTLEEILPQIRAELGADAVILREREGLVGGVGGFFAQRFVEVEARRGDGQSIDVYDEDGLNEDGLNEDGLNEDGLNEDAPEMSALESLGLQPPPQLEAGAPEPEPDPHTPRPFIPPSVTSPRRFETSVFMERLREASATVGDERVEAAEPAPVPDPLVELAADIDANEAIAALQAAVGRPAPDATETAADATAATPAVAETTPITDEATPITDEATPIADEATPDATEATPAVAETALIADETASEPPVAPAPKRPRPASQRPARPAPKRPARPPRPAPTRSAPPPEASDADVAAPEPDLSDPPAVAQPTRGRMFARKRPLDVQPSMASAPAPRPLDTSVAEAVARDLLASGASRAWTDELIAVVSAHGTPLGGGLRAAAQAELARRIMPAPPLPAAGAAIAFIGAGGSGKTRCTAALASAYRRSSTLPVTVVALENPDGARELGELLKADGVPVLALSLEAAKMAVDTGRDGGLVIVDTRAATPTDPTDVQILGAKLAPLELDATYVALPATISANVARAALASFGSLRPTAVTITHADETDQLAVVAEIAIKHRIPLAHRHSGTDHRRALSVIDPAALARELLP